MAGKKLTCFDCGQVNRVAEDRLGDGPICATCGAKLISGKAQEVDFATLQKAARNDDVPLVVDFWAPWCGPCKMMGPEFSKAASSLAGKARLVKLNTDAHQKAGQAYKIKGIPTMIRFENGREVKRQAGAVRMGDILAFSG